MSTAWRGTDAELGAAVLGIVQRWPALCEPCSPYYINGSVFSGESLDGVEWTWAYREVQQSLKRLKKAGLITFERQGFWGEWKPMRTGEGPAREGEAS